MPLPACLRITLVLSALVIAATAPARAQTAGDKMIAEYFRQETASLTEKAFENIDTLEDWEKYKPVAREQLFEMLGLSPRPEKTPLNPVITGTTEHEDFVVENLHFQSRPGLYVTGNLYRPKEIQGKLPTILYVCGHGGVKKDGIIYGNKVHYQHHGAWFARNGYVCLTIDTLQLGEIEGIHHGTYREKMWWWNARGYTSAGVEAWNCIRALDYLETRPEVDASRFGVTGRSGGGAYSWWISALDERIKVAVPVAGITSLHNHVVDGTVEGHCDCMFMVNTYRWDYPMVAALVAPRPLLISNSDKDGIFPLDGVVDVYFKTRNIYGLYGAKDKLGLQITEGPHKDTQELRVHAFHWFNRFLRGEDPLIETTAVPFFEPEQLKVFDKLPEDQINSKIQETFTVKADPKVPESVDEWNTMKQEWMTQLREKVFRGWPPEYSVDQALHVKEAFSEEKDGIRLTAYDFIAQQPIQLRLFVIHKADRRDRPFRTIEFGVFDQQSWRLSEAQFLSAFPNAGYQIEDKEKNEKAQEDWKLYQDILKSFHPDTALVSVAPRGIGPTAWDQNERKQTQIRRRFMLLGQTLDGMQVWDIRRAIHALRSIREFQRAEIKLNSSGRMAGNALYASLFEDGIKEIHLQNLPASHREGPIYLNVTRFLDLSQAAAMAAERTELKLTVSAKDPTSQEWISKSASWQYPGKVLKLLRRESGSIEVFEDSSSDKSE